MRLIRLKSTAEGGWSVIHSAEVGWVEIHWAEVGWVENHSAELNISTEAGKISGKSVSGVRGWKIQILESTAGATVSAKYLCF